MISYKIFINILIKILLWPFKIIKKILDYFKTKNTYGCQIIGSGIYKPINLINNKQMVEIIKSKNKLDKLIEKKNKLSKNKNQTLDEFISDYIIFTDYIEQPINL